MLCKENIRHMGSEPHTSRWITFIVRKWQLILSSFCFIFPHYKFFQHEKKLISPFNNCSWWILLKLRMVWSHLVPGGTSWVQTIPRFSKITTRRMNEENIQYLPPTMIYVPSRSRRFQGFQYRLRYRYQKKGLDDSDTDIDTRDGQNSIPIPILIPRLCKCYKVKYEEMSKFIEWGTQK